MRFLGSRAVLFFVAAWQLVTDSGTKPIEILPALNELEELGRSLKTTNCIENLNGQIERRLENVKRSRHSPQRHWWMAPALLEAETRMRRLTGYQHLSKLKRVM
jgi:hypothetical protein